MRSVAKEQRLGMYMIKICEADGDSACMAAIGVGGEGFAASMRSAVEGVLGHVHEGDVSLRPSSAGKYVSVTVGPVLVENGDQVCPACLYFLLYALLSGSCN